MLGHTCNSSTQDGFQASPGSLVRPGLKEPTNQLVDEQDKKSQPDGSGLNPQRLGKLRQDGRSRACLVYRERKFKAAWVN